MTEVISILVVLALVAAAVFLVFVLGRSLVDASQARRQRLSGDDEGISILPIADTNESKSLAGKIDRGFDDLIAQTGLGLTTAQALGILALSAAVLGAIPIVLRNDWFLAALGVLAGVLLPIAIFSIFRIQYRWKVQNQLADAFFLIARSLRAGLNIEQSMGTVAEYGPQPLAREFRRVVDQTGLGLSVPAAVQGMSRRLDLSDFDAFVTAVTLHRTVGGNLAQLTEQVATSSRDRTQFRGYFRAATALARITGFAIALAPILLLIGYSIWQPDFIERFTNSVLGMRLLVTAAILEVVGAIWMFSLLRVDY
jgi:tight adherence protein B